MATATDTVTCNICRQEGGPLISWLEGFLLCPKCYVAAKSAEHRTPSPTAVSCPPAPPQQQPSHQHFPPVSQQQPLHTPPPNESPPTLPTLPSTAPPLPVSKNPPVEQEPPADRTAGEPQPAADRSDSTSTSSLAHTAADAAADDVDPSPAHASTAAAKPPSCGELRRGSSDAPRKCQQDSS